MGILKTKPKYYMPGDAVTAKIINDVLDTVIDANQTAENNSVDLQTAKQKALEAVSIAQSALDNSGRDAVLVQAQGLFGFQVQDGNLVLSYSGDSAPNLSIDGNGDLIFNC